MSAHARLRVRFMNSPITGQFKLATSPTYSDRTCIARNTSTCFDVVGNYPNPNGLTIDSLRTSVTRMNGEEWVQVNGVRTLRRAARSCPVTWAPSSLSLHASHTLPSSQNELNAAVIKVMAATNPSRTVMSVPTFVGELKDLPGMVLNWGRKLLNKRSSRELFNELAALRKRKVAKTPELLTGHKLAEHLARESAEGHLTYQWVIKPMLGDLMKILEFQTAVSQRFKLLQRLRDEKSINGRGSVSESVILSSTNVPIETQVDIVRATITTTYRRTVWGSCQWKTTDTGPNASNLPQDDQELLEFSHRLVRGITGWESIQTAWELFPWSWFIDWFTRVGSSIAAANNSVHAEPGNFCVMCRRSAKTDYALTLKPSWMTVSTVDQFEHREVKWRIPASLTSPVSISVLPLIDGRKWSILGSLAALKSR